MKAKSYPSHYPKINFKISQLEDDRLEESREPVPVEVKEPAPAPLVPKPTPVTPALKPHALQPPC